MNWIDVAGWLAALFTIGAYAMRTMVPLRFAALGANVFFIVWSLQEGLVQTLVLHAVLLPFNLYRLWEIRAAVRKLRDTRAGDNPLAALKPLLRMERVSAGTRLFSKGDSPDHLYLLQSGTVLLDELDLRLEAGEIFGEIAFLTDEKTRTVGAVCQTDCEIARIDEAAFMRLFTQDPSFGLYIMKLATKRLLDGMQRHPDAYRPAPVGPV
jgi:hypothetical protein